MSTEEQLPAASRRRRRGRPHGSALVAVDNDRRAAWDMRQRGMTLQAIGDHFGVTAEAARKWIKAFREELIAPKRAELVQELREQLDFALERLGPAVAEGDVPAVREWVRINESIRKMYGVDAPTRFQPVPEYQPTPDDAEFAEAIRAAQERNAEHKRQVEARTPAAITAEPTESQPGLPELPAVPGRPRPRPRPVIGYIRTTDR